MFFSIIIPVYNTSRYLDKCIQSVIEQSEKDFEILLIDDGSTDDSGEKCDYYAKENINVRVIHKTNEGLMMTRRRGYKEAIGDYFINLDSDDYLIDENALTKIKRTIIEYNCDLVFYNYILGKENSADDKTIVCFDKPEGLIFSDDDLSKKRLYELYLTGKFLNNMWIKACSRSIVDIDVDYSVWQNDICRAEDRFQSFPLLENAKRIGYVKDQLVYYRWTPGSISNKQKLKYYYAFRTVYQREDEYIKRWNVSDKTANEARLMRIPIILQIITLGYERALLNNKLAEWELFIHNISNDKFFAKMFLKVNSQKVLTYHRFIGYLIIHDHIHILEFVLNSYRWYSMHIKNRK